MYSDFVTNIIYRYSLLKHEIIIIADNPFRIKKNITQKIIIANIISIGIII